MKNRSHILGSLVTDFHFRQVLDPSSPTLEASSPLSHRNGFHHRFLAWFMVRGGGKHASFVEGRKRHLLSGLSGTLVEIGSGAGPNLRYLPGSRREVPFSGACGRRKGNQSSPNTGNPSAPVGPNGRRMPAEQIHRGGVGESRLSTGPHRQVQRAPPTGFSPHRRCGRKVRGRKPGTPASSPLSGPEPWEKRSGTDTLFPASIPWRNERPPCPSSPRSRTRRCSPAGGSGSSGSTHAPRRPIREWE